MIKIVHENGHVSVYLDGEFLFSADTVAEAYKILEEEFGM